MSKLKKPSSLRTLYAVAISLIVIFASTSNVLGESDLLNKPVDSQKTSSMSERIANRKKALKLELSDSAVASVETKCKAAQTKLGQLKSKDTVAIDNYYKTYGEIADQVADLIQRLSRQAVSTAGIQTALNQYVDAVNQYLVDADSYKAGLADLESMDCTADAEGFVASLQDARTQRGKLAANVGAAKIKIDNISAALIGAKDKL